MDDDSKENEREIEVLELLDDSQITHETANAK